MALRDKLRERVQPFLAEGEQIQAVFPARIGPAPWLEMFGAFGTMFTGSRIHYRIVAATDRSIVVLVADRMTGTTPRRVVNRLARDQRLGPTKGWWGRVVLGGEVYRVHRRFAKDVAEADASLGRAS